jgi:hemolysin III
MVLELVFPRRWRALSLGLYIAMGWVVVVAVGPLLAALPTAGLVLLLLGGLAYTGGIGFYAWKALPFGHAVWHLFVLAGTILHFLAILLYVVP